MACSPLAVSEAALNSRKRRKQEPVKEDKKEDTEWLAALEKINEYVGDVSFRAFFLGNKYGHGHPTCFHHWKREIMSLPRVDGPSLLALFASLHLKDYYASFPLQVLLERASPAELETAAKAGDETTFQLLRHAKLWKDIGGHFLKPVGQYPGTSRHQYETEFYTLAPYLPYAPFKSDLTVALDKAKDVLKSWP